MDHNGFIVANNEVIMVFDYDHDPAHALKRTLDQHPQTPVVFFVTHYEKEHHDNSLYEIAQNHKRVYVMSNDVYPQNVPDTLAVAGMSKGDVLDNLPGGLTVKAYGSTGKGVSYLVTLPDGTKIFHAGQLNDWHFQDEKSMREVEKENELFKTELNRIAQEQPAVDIAFFIVDTHLGSDYARGAREFLKAVKVRDFFPMHFNGDVQKACDFNAYAPEGTTCHCLHTPGESIEL